jgi:DHA1 family bicyclomycin/chloramphenicol resistance-like MFS transporter
MRPAVVVTMLTLLLGVQPITTDLYLPSLPTLGRELHASVGATQLTLSTLLICFGLGQLVWGPLADRYGRRPVLLAGMGGYTIASVLAAVAPSIEWLVAARALQGAAMAAAVTCGRSIVRDLFEPHEGARVMSRALGGLGLIAMLGPLLGGALVQWVDWHAALAVLAVFGACTLAFVAWRFEETLREPNPAATQAHVLWRNWKTVAQHPGFRAWAALLSLSYGGLFVFLAGSSFVFTEVLGVSRVAYGAIMASGALAYISGTLVCRRLLARHGLRGTVKRGALFTLLGGGSMALLSLAGVISPWAIAVPQVLFAMGHGIHQPCGQVGAVGPFPEKAGAASALAGFLMMVASFVIGLVMGRQLNGTVFPVTLGVGALSAGIVLVAWTLVQRDGEPRAERAAQPA